MILVVTTRAAEQLGAPPITYHRVDAFRVGPDGALRLYKRRGWLFLVQRAYHPAGEWVAIRREEGDDHR
jgi:hypothetical protein